MALPMLADFYQRLQITRLPHRKEWYWEEFGPKHWLNALSSRVKKSRFVAATNAAGFQGNLKGPSACSFDYDLTPKVDFLSEILDAVWCHR